MAIRASLPVAALTILLLHASAHGQAADSVTGAAGRDDPDFAALQTRGLQAMGVDQYTSTHLFDALPDGGRIELQRDVDDPAGIAEIRAHLQEIQRAFSAGDFTTPAFVHSQEVPGTAVMAAKKDEIEYIHRDLPRGGELRLVSTDPEVIEAIRAFMAFQRADHRSGGVDHSPTGGSGMEHQPGMHHGGADHSDTAAPEHADHEGTQHAPAADAGRPSTREPSP